MQNLSKTKKPRRSISTGVRIMITISAVATTLGLWVVFARQSMISQALALKVSDPIQETPSQDAVVILPPMPTLIPQLPENGGLASLPSAPVVSSSAPSFQGGVKILLGGQAPRTQRSAPMPFTTTRSSR